MAVFFVGPRGNLGTPWARVLSNRNNTEGLLRAIGPNDANVIIDEVLADSPPKRRRKCTCFSCEHPLVAHREASRAHRRRAHFKHAAGSACYAAKGGEGRGGEGAIHLTAKLHLRAQLE